MTTGLAEELARAAQDGDTELGTRQLEAGQAWLTTRQPAGCCYRTDLHDAGVVIEFKHALAIGAVVVEDSSEYATEHVIAELADEGDPAMVNREVRPWRAGTVGWAPMAGPRASSEEIHTMDQHARR